MSQYNWDGRITASTKFIGYLHFILCLFLPSGTLIQQERRRSHDICYIYIIYVIYITYKFCIYLRMYTHTLIYHLSFLPSLQLSIISFKLCEVPRKKNKECYTERRRGLGGARSALLIISTLEIRKASSKGEFTSSHQSSPSLSLAQQRDRELAELG